MNMQSTSLLADYHGTEITILNLLDNEAYVLPCDPADKRAWASGLRRGSGIARWVAINELQPAECECRPDGPRCRACSDWHTIMYGDEMPY